MNPGPLKEQSFSQSMNHLFRCPLEMLFKRIDLMFSILDIHTHTYKFTQERTHSIYIKKHRRLLERVGIFSTSNEVMIVWFENPELYTLNITRLFMCAYIIL